MHVADLERVVRQVVVHDVRQVIARREEAEHAAVVVQELLLRLDFAATERLLQEVPHLGVVLAHDGALRHLEVVSGRARRGRQVSSLLLHHKAFES